jgi:PAS domain S-box-containing protein
MTDYKKIRDDLLIENERKFRLLAENSIDCIWMMDTSLKFTYLSPSLEQIFGYKPEEWIGTHLSNHFREKEFLHAGSLVMEALNDYRNFQKLAFESKMLNKANEEIDVEITGRIAKDDNDKLIGLQGTTRDITEKKKTGNALVESERRLSTLMSNLPGMAYRCSNDEDWTMEFVSDGCKALTGFGTTDLINNSRISYAGLIHPEDRYAVWMGVNEGLKKKRMFQLTYRIITKTGIEKWVYEQGQGIYSKNVEPALEGFITDISEQKKAEEELVKSLKEKSVLLSEIHHRVKNNMQLIISLLDLQKLEVSKSLDPVLEDIIERIRIFADIHQDLYQSERITEIDISEHVQTIFRNLKHVYNKTGKHIALEMNIPNPLFSLNIAIPLGLMINELISNSLKHAFNGEEGRISISIIPGGNDRIESIQYTDSGSKLKTNRGGFGTVLLDAMATQLQLTMTVTPDGRYKFSFHA